MPIFRGRRVYLRLGRRRAIATLTKVAGTVQQGSGSASAHGDATATGILKARGTASTSGHGDASGAGQLEAHGTSSALGTGAASGSGQLEAFGSSSTSGHGDAGGSGHLIAGDSGSSSGHGDASGVTGSVQHGSGSGSGSTKADASGTLIARGTGSASGHGTASGSGTLIKGQKPLIGGQPILTSGRVLPIEVESRITITASINMVLALAMQVDSAIESRLGPQPLAVFSMRSEVVPQLVHLRIQAEPALQQTMALSSLLPHPIGEMELSLYNEAETLRVLGIPA